MSGHQSAMARRGIQARPTFLSTQEKAECWDIFMARGPIQTRPTFFSTQGKGGMLGHFHGQKENPDQTHLPLYPRGVDRWDISMARGPTQTRPTFFSTLGGWGEGGGQGAVGTFPWPEGQY